MLKKLKRDVSAQEVVLRCQVADRIKVRDYILSKNTDVKLIPLLWDGVDFNQSVWDALPSRFVIKANHGSGMILIVDKAKDSYFSVRDRVMPWLKKDFYRWGREWVYKDLEKKLIVEGFLDLNGTSPPDFKFFCVHNKVELIQVHLNRFKNHGQHHYDRNFVRVHAAPSDSRDADIAKPALFDKAVSIAEHLSADFDFIRVDLYIMDDCIYFGELTNTPDNGLLEFFPKFEGLLGGKWLKKD